MGSWEWRRYDGRRRECRGGFLVRLSAGPLCNELLSLRYSLHRPSCMGQGGRVTRPQDNSIQSMGFPVKAEAGQPLLGDTMKYGGQGGIRTHGELAPTAVFKTAALNHSATCPCAAAIARGRPAASETLPARPVARMTRLVPPRPSQAARICARRRLWVGT